MSNIINFTEAQTKKLREEKMHINALMDLFTKLQTEIPENHLKIIHTFLENFRGNDKFVAVALKLIATDHNIKSHTEKALRTLSYEDREQILTTIGEIWPKEIPTVSRIKHILKLWHFCSRQVPKMPFFQIIPSSIVMKFLLAEKKK